MEELSRQMGESLPTAMKAMEMATGKTGMELNKLISSGQLMTKDVLIPFANALRVLARRNGALAAGQQKVIAQQMRMGSAFKTLIDDMFQKGGNKSFSHIFMDVTKVIEHMTPVIEETGRVVLNLAEAISSVVSQFVLMVGWSDKSVKSAGAVRMAWNLVLSTFLALSEAILLVAWGFAKVNELSDESNARIMEGKRLYSGGTTIFSPPTPQQSKTVTNTTTIGDINITSSSTDPKQSAIEMTSMISNIITAGR
jgi:hypothetical protein